LAVPKVSRAAALAALLDSPEIELLVEELDAVRWTGRPGNPTRALLGACLIKALYALPTWTRTAALIAEHEALQRALGAVPSVYACYRFAAKLRRYRDLLDACLKRLVRRLAETKPEFGIDLAIDASDLPAYANGQRYVSKGGRERAPEEYSDQDASWGHRSAISTRKGGGFYGYRLHLAICTRTELPVAWRVETARANESTFAAPLVEQARGLGLDAETCAMDKGYDSGPVYDDLEAQGCSPVVPLRRTTGVRRGDHLLPYDGPPTRLHPRIDRDSDRWRSLYKRRGAVERAFGRLKHEWGLRPLRVRGLDRVSLHLDLTILAQLACALSR
jgi:hypothetical protein